MRPKSPAPAALLDLHPLTAVHTLSAPGQFPPLLVPIAPIHYIHQWWCSVSAKRVLSQAAAAPTPGHVSAVDVGPHNTHRHFQEELPGQNGCHGQRDVTHEEDRCCGSDARGFDFCDALSLFRELTVPGGSHRRCPSEAGGPSLKLTPGEQGKMRGRGDRTVSG